MTDDDVTTVSDMFIQAAGEELLSAFGMIEHLQAGAASDLALDLPPAEALVHLQALQFSAVLALATLQSAQVRATLALAAAIKESRASV